MRIGDFQLETNVLLAPIAGYCDVSFRLVVRSIGGVGLACTDLLSPQGILRKTSRCMELAATCPEDQPLCVQLYGCDAGLMADAAAWAQHHGARVIDINMGCPADKIVKKGGGVTLMGDPPRAQGIAAAVVRAVTVPVTVKMRLGCDDSDLVAPRLACMLEDVGVQAVTVHGRTGQQRFGGQVDHDGIAAVVGAVRGIPVIGNGDVKSPQDAKAMVERTGCAGLMIGRRALADPWIFRDTHAYLTTGEIPPPPTVRQRMGAVVRHFENLRRFRGDRAACVAFRQRISWYARMLPRTKELKRRMNRIDTPAEFYEIIDQYLQQSRTPGSVWTRITSQSETSRRSA
jgi:nifR3 family TIM-barrel protein